MGKDARKERQQRSRDRRRSADGARVADAGALAAGLVWENMTADVAAACGPLAAAAVQPLARWSRWVTLRAGYRSFGVDWPDWCYLPYECIAAAIAGEIEKLAGVSMPETMGGVLGLVPVVNWYPGRIVVRYHPELLTCLLDTPLDGTIPAEALYRLPAYGLYLDTPQLGPGAGAFVCVDPARTTGTAATPLSAVTYDELMVTCVLPEAAKVFSFSYWLAKGTIAESIDAQSHGGGRLTDAGLHDLVGRGQTELHAELLSMLLYLCAEDPDLVETTMPVEVMSGSGGASHAVRESVAVLDAGWRIGAALGAARDMTTHSQRSDGATGRHVSPHLRRAHWHHYWTGPRSEPQARVLILRWVAPTLVGTEGEAPITVRAAH